MEHDHTDIEIKSFWPVLYQQAQVNYTPFATAPDVGIRQCAFCRWYQQDAMSHKGTCRIVVDYPKDILPTGLCDEFEDAGDAINAAQPDIEALFDTPPAMDMENEDMPMERQKKEQPDSIYITPKPIETGLLDKLRRKTQQQITITKQADGLRRAVIVTSNGYKDAELEHVAQAALTDYVDKSFMDGQFIGDNKLDFWHGFDIGHIVAAVVEKGFLVEVAEEMPGLIERKLWDYFETTQNNGTIQWGASQEFYPVETDGNVYKKIRKTRTSILPIERAANRYTYSKVFKMSEQNSIVEHFNKAVGIPNALQIIAEQGVNALELQLSKAGEVAKQADAPEADSPAAPAPADNEAMNVVMKAFGAGMNELVEAQAELLDSVQALETVRKENGDSVTKLNDAVAKLNKRLEVVEQAVTDAPRSASEGTAATIAVDDDLANKIKEITSEPDDFWDGLVAKPVNHGA